MTPKDKARAEERSRKGSGPGIVTQETLNRLEQLGAPKHLIKAAHRAIKTNPV
jgi:hypothetical protein